MSYTAKHIRENCQKKKEEEQFYAWFVMRRISPYFSSLLLKTSISANTVTLTGIILGVAGGILYIIPSMTGALFGSLLVQIWYLSDCVDGEMARCRKVFSDEGIYLDALGHHVVSFSAMGGFVAGLYIEKGNTAMLIAGILFVTFYHFNKMIFTAAEQTVYGKYKGEDVKLRFPGSEKDFFNRYSNKEYPAPVRLFLWAFRLWPSTGASINEIGILVAMMLTSVADYLIIKPFVGEGIYPDSRTIIVYFYALMLPLSFLARFATVIRRSYVTKWLAGNGKERDEK